MPSRNCPDLLRSYGNPQPTTRYTVACVKTAVEISEESPGNTPYSLISLSLDVHYDRAMASGGSGGWGSSSGLEGLARSPAFPPDLAFLSVLWMGRHI